MLKEEKRQFFATKIGEPKVIHMNGKAAKFENFTPEEKANIMKRLAEKDAILNRGMSGELPGLKIDGKVVTKENIKEFEISSKPLIKSTENEKIKMTLEQLKKLNKSQQTEILKKLGVSKIPLLEQDRINEILKLQ